MKNDNRLYKNNGSITLFVLVSMLFFVTILTTTYVNLGNRQQSQREETEIIKKQYAKTDEEIEKLYSETAKKYPRIMLTTVQNDVEYSVNEETEENLNCKVGYAGELKDNQIILVNKSNEDNFVKYTDEIEITENCNIISVIGNVIENTENIDLKNKYISVDGGNNFVLYSDEMEIDLENESTVIAELTDKKTMVSITKMI